MVKYYKALHNLVHSESGERITIGTFFSDEGTDFDPTIGTAVIQTGKAIPNVKQAPPPILWRKGFFAGKAEDDISFLLLQGAITEIEADEDDYAYLQTHGVIPSSSKSKSKPQEKDKD